MPNRVAHAVVVAVFPIASMVSGASSAQIPSLGSIPAATPRVAFYYGADPAWDALAAFDWVVVEPAYVPSPPRTVAKTEVMAYLAVGEMQPSRPYFADVPAAWRRGENPAWSSIIIDQTDPAWPRFVVERIARPLWNAGYRGFFLDTLDAYHLVAKTPLERALQEAGLVRVVQALKAAFPSARFVLNRGFEILPVVRDAVAAVAAESIYQGWDPATKGYREVPAADRDALVPLLARVRDEYQLPVIAIDYVAPEEPALARTTAARIFALGFIPYVSNRALDIVGVGAVAAANDDARGELLARDGFEAHANRPFRASDLGEGRRVPELVARPLKGTR